jgi:hypothetical protein
MQIKSNFLRPGTEERRATARAAIRLWLSLLFTALVRLSVLEAAEPVPPSVSYWHVWTSKDGVSHQTKETLRNFDLESIEPPASPQWLDKLEAGGANIMVAVLPVGWRGDWHENPHRQWIIPLSGRWFVETMDRVRVVMGPGEVSFGEDQATKPNAEGHKGHLSGTVGNKPAVLMIVQLPDVPAADQPTRYH